jgi:hypothetical protein
VSPESCNLEVETDASDVGYGIWFQGLLTNGPWDSICMMTHINVKEIIALWIFLVDVEPSLHHRSILWRVDNTTALACVRKEGGLHSTEVLEWAEKILILAHSRQLRILPVYIPSEENLQADAASRFLEVPDWHLDPQVFKKIASLWGRPVINLFATRESAQTPEFFSWQALDRPLAVDALAQKWDFPLAFLFPPVALLRRVVRKLESSRGIFILVSPYWESQTWFASILSLQVKEVRRLPFSQRLLVDLRNGAPPPILKRLQLVAWSLAGFQILY